MLRLVSLPSLFYFTVTLCGLSRASGSPRLQLHLRRRGVPQDRSVGFFAKPRSDKVAAALVSALPVSLR
jgi:hypothetical protein